MGEKKNVRTISIGLMLFALFFGAGNLIFPAAMGQHAGINVWWAVLGFIVTGVGLPLLGVLAMGYYRLLLSAPLLRRRGPAVCRMKLPFVPF